MIVFVVVVAALIGWIVAGGEVWGAMIGGLFGWPFGAWLRTEIRTEIRRGVAAALEQLHYQPREYEAPVPAAPAAPAPPMETAAPVPVEASWGRPREWGLSIKKRFK